MQRKKVSLAVDTAPVGAAAAGAATGNGVPVVTDGGSFHGDGISIGMAGLRVNDRSVAMSNSSLAAASMTSSIPTGPERSADVPASSASGGEGDRGALDQFKVLRELGSGTSGVVRLVQHRPSRKRYAMKVIALGCSDQERKQIIVEIKTLHKSDVPGIIAFKNAFYCDNSVHIVLEYMNCGSLGSVLSRHGALPEALLARVTSDVVRGLDHLHRVIRVVHRDIKPGNVLLNAKGEVKLADFGMSGQLASTFSRLASWVGTAAYMSPERISGSEYSYESDIWALGVSLWECAVGRYPYGTPVSSEGVDAPRTLQKQGSGSSLLPGDEQRTGMTFWDLLYAIVECEPSPLPSGCFSASFEQLVAACMVADGSMRPSVAAILAHAWLAEASEASTSLAEWLVPDPE